MNISSNTYSSISSYQNLYNKQEESAQKNSQNTPEALQSEEEKQKAKEKEKNTKGQASETLSAGEKQMVAKLQARDTEVRAHEAAHQSAGAPTGGASFSYQQGPDGKMYAIGGEVSISISSGSTPDETIRNMQQVVAAAMAPADPSPQDYSVASSARMMMLKAQQQKAKELQDQMLGRGEYANASKEQSEKTEGETPKLDIPA